VAGVDSDAKAAQSREASAAWEDFIADVDASVDAYRRTHPADTQSKSADTKSPRQSSRQPPWTERSRGSRRWREKAKHFSGRRWIPVQERRERSRRTLAEWGWEYRAADSYMGREGRNQGGRKRGDSDWGSPGGYSHDFDTATEFAPGILSPGARGVHAHSRRLTTASIK